MAGRHSPLPPGGELLITDGGLETVMIFDEGLELAHFAAFPLLRDAAGRDALARYYASYLPIAVRDRRGIVVDTPTWRASADWGALLGYDASALDAVNQDAVRFVRDQGRRGGAASSPVVVSGCVGPRRDGYVVSDAMSVDEAAEYHSAQIASFAGADVDLVTAMTLNHVDEAEGITHAALAAGVPVVVSFTVDVDGRLPSGMPLGEAIEAVDEQTDNGPVHYMINCAHPVHFVPVLDPATRWTSRVGGVRANASTLSHAELDEAEALDRGDPSALAAAYRTVRSLLPNLRVVGGCCGTDHRHVDAISSALVNPAPAG